MSKITARRKRVAKTSTSSNGEKTSAADPDISASYNKFKKFEGKQYTGMQIGEVTNGIMIKANGKKKR